MINNEKIYCESSEIVCPYCGYEHNNSGEIMEDEEDLGLQECSHCEKSFYAHRVISVTYCTEKARYGTCKCCDEKDVALVDYRGSLGEYDGLCVKCGREELNRMLSEYWINISKGGLGK